MNIPYRIQEIKTSQFAIFPEKFVNDPTVEIKIETAFNFGINIQQKCIRCICKISYIQNEELLMVLEEQCIFGIAPDAISELEKTKRVPVDFLRYLGTIAIGTARGIIHTRTENTLLNRFVLPPINLINIIKKDFVFKAPGEK